MSTQASNGGSIAIQTKLIHTHIYRDVYAMHVLVLNEYSAWCWFLCAYVYVFDCHVVWKLVYTTFGLWIIDLTTCVPVLLLLFKRRARQSEIRFVTFALFLFNFVFFVFRIQRVTVVVTFVFKRPDIQPIMCVYEQNFLICICARDSITVCIFYYLNWTLRSKFHDHRVCHIRMILYRIVSYRCCQINFN